MTGFRFTGCQQPESEPILTIQEQAPGKKVFVALAQHDPECTATGLHFRRKGTCPMPGVRQTALCMPGNIPKGGREEAIFLVVLTSGFRIGVGNVSFPSGVGGGGGGWGRLRVRKHWV